MGYETYVASPGDTKTGITKGADVGDTNNLNTVVGVGQIAIIVEDSVAGATNGAHNTLVRALEILRERDAE